eukprot:5426475-Prorocentrum_lima.AAC.1
MVIVRRAAPVAQELLRTAETTAFATSRLSRGGQRSLKMTICGHPVVPGGVHGFFCLAGVVKVKQWAP